MKIHIMNHPEITVTIVSSNSAQMEQNCTLMGIEFQGAHAVQILKFYFFALRKVKGKIVMFSNHQKLCKVAIRKGQWVFK